MKFPEYDHLDATDLASLIHQGEVSPSEVLEAAIERVEQRNPQLNAVVHPLFERARQKVNDLPDGPLKGVPFLLKDLKAMMAGTPTSNGTQLFKGRVAQETSLIVDRFEAAGLQAIGESNSPEFGIMGVTEPEIWGPCRNPWNLDRTPGGSSGGASSAVASRIVPIAHAGDGGGSIRIPASACGLFGIKPTRGRVSMAPFRGEGWGGFVQENVVSRSVRDSALCLDMIDAPTLGEPYAAPYKEKPWVEHLHAPTRPLKVAFTSDTLFAGESHPSCQAGVKEAVRLFESLGHHVEEACPPFPREALVEAYFYTVASGTACFVDETCKIKGIKPHHRYFEPATWLLAQIGWTCSAATLAKARDTIQHAARPVAQFFDQYDLFVSSTHAQPPVLIGELEPNFKEKMQLQLIRTLNLRTLLDMALKSLGTKALARTPNTQLFNQTGQPAMSIPLYWDDSGMPVGIQVASHFGGEGLLFQVATQLEEAAPWAHRLPPFVEKMLS